MFFFNFEKRIFNDFWIINKEIKVWPIKSMPDFWKLLKKQMGQILYYVIKPGGKLLEE